MRATIALGLLIGCQEYGVNDILAPAETATLAVDPPQIDFGVLEAGETATATFTITNLGPGDASLEGLDLVYTTAYAIPTAPHGALLAGDTVDVAIEYTATTPHDVGAAVVHSDATNGSLRVDLTGGARLAKLVVEPGRIDFACAAGEPVTHSAFVRNEGLAPLRVEQHYIDEPSFAAEHATIPYDLDPGEEIELPITWTPAGEGTADGQLWVGSDAGDATAALHGDWTLCYGVAEAWDQGWLELALDSAGSHTLTNLGEYDVCMTRWMPFFSNASQDTALGKSTLEGDAAQIVIPSNESVTFLYEADFDPSWMCIEQTQVIEETTDFWFFGANVPEPLRAKLAFDYQEDVWEEIASNPVVLVGREHTAFDLSVGESTPIAVEAMNLGRVDADAQITERVPPWLSVVDAGDATKTLEADGSTTLVWNVVTLLAALDTSDTHDPTIYDRHYLSYVARLEQCPSQRNVGEAPSAIWADAGFTERASTGSPLVVYCKPSALRREARSPDPSCAAGRGRRSDR